MHLEVIKIAQNMPLRTRTARSIDRPGAAPSSTDLGIDPPKFLAAMLPASPAAVGLDIRRGVVSLMTQRCRAMRPCPSLADSASDGHMTPPRANALRARRADSPEDIEAARHLVRRRYAWRGYRPIDLEDRPARRLRESSPREITFVANEHTTIVGTITLGLDGPGGLLAEGTHSEAIQAQRAAGRRVCELTRLAVAERADSKSVLAALFSLAYAAGSAHRVTDVFIEVTPRHASFYTRVLGFVVTGTERVCERVGVPSVLLWLEIEQLAKRMMSPNTDLSAVSFAAQAA